MGDWILAWVVGGRRGGDRGRQAPGRSPALHPAGRAAVVRSAGDINVVIAELKPGDFIGRIPFLDTGHEPYSAAIHASADLALEPVNLSPIQTEYDRLPQAFKNIIENMSACISATTQIACSSFSLAGKRDPK